MESKWKTYKLGEVYEFSSGLSKKREEFGFGYPFITFKDVFNNYFVPDRLTELVNSTEKERESCSVKRGDVFLTRTSETLEELGMSCVALKYFSNTTFNGFSKKLRPKYNDLILPEYAGFYFRSLKFRKEITAMASMTTRASLNNSMMEKLTIVVPPMQIQQKISSILISLNKKNEINNEMNKTLEEMAQAIFKAWFVDFEPFKDGEFQESELGMIPKGWNTGKVSDLCDVSSSKRIFMADYRESGIPFYRGKEIIEKSKGNDISTEIYIDIEKFNEIKNKFGLPKKGDILLTSVGTIGVPYLVKDEEFYFKDGNLTWFKDFKLEGCNLYIYYWIKYGEGKNNIDKVTIGSTQKALTISSLKDMKILIPSDEYIKKFSCYLTNIVNKYESNLSENTYLKNIRDTLLPKLISGEIRLDI